MAINVQHSIAMEVADFLTSEPSLEDLANYAVAPETQQYLDGLLEKNSAGELSPDERLELEKLLTISHVMTLIKTKAKLKLAGRA